MFLSAYDVYYHVIVEDDVSTAPYKDIKETVCMCELKSSYLLNRKVKTGRKKVHIGIKAKDWTDILKLHIYTYIYIDIRCRFRTSDWD